MTRSAKGRRYSPARANAYRRRLREAGWRWFRTGGGTMIARIPGHIRFPCDDSYENLVTGEVVVLKCTLDAHFGALRKLSKTKSLRKILATPGVKLDRRIKAEVDRC